MRGWYRISKARQNSSLRRPSTVSRSENTLRRVCSAPSKRCTNSFMPLLCELNAFPSSIARRRSSLAADSGLMPARKRNATQHSDGEGPFLADRRRQCHPTAAYHCLWHERRGRLPEGACNRRARTAETTAHANIFGLRFCRTRRRRRHRVDKKVGCGACLLPRQAIQASRCLWAVPRAASARRAPSSSFVADSLVRPGVGSGQRNSQVVQRKQGLRLRSSRPTAARTSSHTSPDSLPA